ncbi:Transmembrane and TPR repeat-containing protein 2 [Nymphon striatum]|nr:Transmembrane and TPR repeat-containing protein 2 [Nymphon striatum]
MILLGNPRELLACRENKGISMMTTGSKMAIKPTIYFYPFISSYYYIIFFYFFFLYSVLYMCRIFRVSITPPFRAIKTNYDLLPTTPWANIFYNDFWGTPLTHSGSHKSYRPLCVLTFRLNHLWSKMNPWSYHLVNIIMHSAVTGLFTYFASTIFSGRTFPTLVAGLLFAAHPIHTEAVSGVVGRADVGACFFFLLSFIFYVNYCKSRNLMPKENSNVRWIYLFASILCATCSMLTKEHGITVLCVCGTYDLFVQSRLRPKDIIYILFEKKYRHLLEGPVSLLISVIVLLSFRFYLMGMKAPDFAPADNPAADSDSFITRTLTFLYLPVFNFWLMLYPRVLSFDWSMESIPLITSLSDHRNFFSLIFYSLFIYINLHVINCLNKNRDCKMCDHPVSGGISSKSNGHGNYVMSINHNYRFPASYQNIQKFKKSAYTNGHCNGTTNLNNFHHRSATNGYSQLENCATIYTTTSPGSSYVTYMNPTDNSSSKNIDILIVSMAFLVFPFIPATNLFFYVGFVIAERVLFIPSMGFVLLVAMGANNIYQSAQKEDKSLFKLFLGLIGLVVIAFAARTVRRNYDWRSEEALYRSGIEINPPKAYGNLANILSSLDRKAEAEIAYKKALSYRSNMADVHYNLGILLQEQKRLEEALQSYKNSIQFRPRMAMAHLNLGLVLSTLGRKEEAMEVYRHCSQIDGSGLKDPKTHESTKISALFNLGRLYDDEGKHSEAIEVYKKAVRKLPPHYPAQSLFNMLGEAYYKLNRYNEAELWYKKALQTKPDHIPAHLTYGKLLSKRNRSNEAEKVFNRAKQLAPNDSSVYQHFGQFLSESARHQEAAELFLEAVMLSPKEYEIVFNTANSLREAHRHDEAEYFYHQAVRLRPQEATSHMNLGAMLHLNGKYLEAEASYLEALRLKPDDGITQNNLQKLRAILIKKGLRPANYHPEARR